MSPYLPTAALRWQQQQETQIRLGSCFKKDFSFVLYNRPEENKHGQWERTGSGQQNFSVKFRDGNFLGISTMFATA